MPSGAEIFSRFRHLPVDLRLPSGWVSGTFLVPESQSLQDFLATSGPFLKLIDATVPGHESAVPFFAVRREATELVAPQVEESHVETPGSAGITSPWGVICLFDRGLLEGRLDFLTNQRLSDYLRGHSGFLVVREAAWIPLDGDRVGESRHWPIALANVSRLNGVSELPTQPGRGHPGRLAPTEFGEPGR
ncbi:MAG TPA: hypothetical protein VNK43_05365 [Gemmatimonadales bacterium]|nr:hypothetical protein [Gemmatimonadales bacterium]